MAVSPKIEEKEKSGKLKNFILLGVIPTLFAITILLFALTLSGINIFDRVGEWGKKVPVIGEIFGGESEQSSAEQEQKLAELRGQLKDREMEIQTLKNALSEKEEEIERLQFEKEQIRQQEPVDEGTETKLDFRDIVKTYENMSSKRAATIINNLTDEEAIKILTHLRPEQRAAIMEKMNPEQAAKYTKMFLTEEDH